MNLEVIGAGVGRTGTYSLKLALNQLGLGPCYHMEEVILDMPGKLPLWQAVVAGDPDFAAVWNWGQVLFRASVKGSLAMAWSEGG